MKKVKLCRGKHRSRSIAAFFNAMFKSENITVLILIVLAHQTHGIYAQGKKIPNSNSQYKLEEILKNSIVCAIPFKTEGV